MHILARPVINEFVRKRPLSASSLNGWYFKTERAIWNDYPEVKETFNTCDYIGNDRYVFDITGNHYRLIAMIHFKRKRVYIRGTLTHAEYDIMSRKGLLQTL